jgi:peptidase M28-like protein
MKIKIFPSGRREWLWVALQLIIFTVVFIAASFYVVSMPGRSYTGQLDALTEDETQVRDRLRVHVSTLADKIGERNLKHYDALTAAASYIEKELRAVGLETAAQEYEVEGKSVANLETEIRGTSNPEELVVVGAHYDSVSGSPGANDNASGVAALLELARRFQSEQHARTIRFVAFVDEEPPYFQTERMGSSVYAKRSRQRGEKIVAMLSLETIGYYSDADKSQIYPLPFRWFYPSKGNFIGFVGNTSSRTLTRRSVRQFRQGTRFPSEGVAAPGWMTGVGWSDQWSFWKEGYPAVMITDTALFRYPYYHKLADTPEKVDYDRMTRTLAGVRGVIKDLADN